MPALRTAAAHTAPPAFLRTLPQARIAANHPPTAAPLRAAGPATLPENPVELLRESVAALVAMDAALLQGLAARAMRAQKLRGWTRMSRREQAMFLAERALLEALLAETRRNLRLLESLSPAGVATARPRADGSAYAATGAMWVD